MHPYLGQRKWKKLHKYFWHHGFRSVYIIIVSRVEEQNDLYKRDDGKEKSIEGWGENFGMTNGMKSENRIIDLIKVRGVMNDSTVGDYA